jgi:hypothetical protein
MSAGCELDETSIAQPESVLVAETYVFVGDGEDDVTAFLHWTLGAEPSMDLRDVQVRVTGEDGTAYPLVRGSARDCLQSETAEVVEGECFSLFGAAEGIFHPGERVQVDVQLPDGGSLSGTARIPGAYAMVTPWRPTCRLPPDTSLEVVWTRAEGAWAYSAETLIWGIREALAPRGIEVDEDPLSLLGLAISETDTTIVYPSEFGVFSRFDLDRELALVLQGGLPEGTTADVTVVAVDRNYVNWVRGGTFNPSGQVRIPSLRGDGTGVVGSGVRRLFRADARETGVSIPSCSSGT